MRRKINGALFWPTCIQITFAATESHCVASLTVV